MIGTDTIIFILSKLLWQVAQPSGFLTVTLAVGAGLCWTRWHRLGQVLVSVAAACQLLVALLPVGSWLARPLEERFPPPPPPARVDGIIVLGGGIDPFVTAERGQPALNAYAGRLTAFAQLARQYPEARLVFAGGSGTLAASPMSEADVARQVFAGLGLDTGRIIFENRSRNTLENAVFSRALAQPAAGETWLLVTSAVHMPRSVGVFRRAGWPVTPWPVDYKTLRRDNLPATASLSPRFAKLDLAVHEWLGLLAYRLMGRTDALLPAP